jgi:hypothetical protein
MTLPTRIPPSGRALARGIRSRSGHHNSSIDPSAKRRPRIAAPPPHKRAEYGVAKHGLSEPVSLQPAQRPLSELLQEAHVVLVEQPEVGDPVFEYRARSPSRTRTPGPSRGRSRDRRRTRTRSGRPFRPRGSRSRRSPYTTCNADRQPRSHRCSENTRRRPRFGEREEVGSPPDSALIADAHRRRSRARTSAAFHAGPRA